MKSVSALCPTSKGCETWRISFRCPRHFHIAFYHHDPHLRVLVQLTAWKENREATPEEMASRLGQQRLDLDKLGLVFAEAGATDAFCVKWKEHHLKERLQMGELRNG